MKKVLKNTKGFTLVELLAVIVVLAVIILIAMPAVMNSMEKARRNAFAVEANELVKIAQTAYSDLMMKNLTGNSYCFSYQYLKDAGFLEKNDTNYSGSVSVNIDSNGKASYKIWLTNKNFMIDGKTVSEIETSKISTLNASGSVSQTCDATATYSHLCTSTNGNPSCT